MDNETVRLDIDSGMHISHVGTSYLYSPHSKTCLLSSNLLHVPNISKNLISVSKFANDNHVYLEFHVNYCYVKKQDTNQIILKGFLKNGLYVFPTLQYSSDLNVNTVTIDSVNNTLPLWISRFDRFISYYQTNLTQL